MTSLDSKPRDDEVDVFGLTDPGKVRGENEDHFLLCSLHKTMRIHATSLPDPSVLAGADDRLGFLAVVADGLGGHARGEEASRLTVETVARYATHCMDCFYARRPGQEQLFLDQLHETALRCHDAVTREASQRPAQRGMATTLTLLLTMWPRMYVLQVGDSRCYLLHEGVLHRLTRDQTLAQELIDAGAMTSDEAEASRYAHVLSSAIGGETPRPISMAMSFDRDDVILLCTDGLTRHAPDDEIREHLLRSTSAEQKARDLLALALDRGGEDNITLAVGQLRRRASES